MLNQQVKKDSNFILNIYYKNMVSLTGKQDYDFTLNINYKNLFNNHENFNKLLDIIKKYMDFKIFTKLQL